MKQQIRALAWEEFRVGGAIAAVCLFFALLFLTQGFLLFGSRAWSTDRELMLLFGLGMPVLAALLLILNTGNSGHLAGGYSERILRLPVPTWLTVAVSLFSRTLLVLVTISVSTLAAWNLFYDPPGPGIILLVTVLYVTAQVLDWLRGWLSGLTSLLVIALAALAIPIALHHEAYMETLVSLPWRSGGVALLLAVLAAAYGTSVAAVHATRVGRTLGVPEVWEWPRYAPTGRGREKPFASPFAAQVWFEFRRTGWVMPLLALFAWLPGLLIWTYGEQETSLVRMMNVMSAPLLLVLGAFVQGAYARRRDSRYPALLPVTVAELAWARTSAMAVSLGTSLALFTVVQVAFVAPGYTFVVLPAALRLGSATYQEAAWSLVARVVLVGLAAWAGLALTSTRLVAGMVTAVIVVVTGVTLTASLLFHTNVLWVAGTVAFCSVPLGFAAGAGAFARARRILAGRALCTWAVLWLLTATLLLRHTISGGAHPFVLAMAVVQSAGLAALVPLPFLGWALHFHRRRHGALPAQEDIPPQRNFGRPGPVAVALLVAALVFVLWLTVHREPGYKAVWRAYGLPADLRELDAWYKTPPPGENAALAYLEAAEMRSEKEAVFHDSAVHLPDDGYESFPRDESGCGIDYVVIVGNAPLERAEPVHPLVWERTGEYWRTVSHPVAERLKTIAQTDYAGSRYPVDLTRGSSGLDLSHLSHLRALTRELSLDSFYWAMKGEPGKAVDAIEAMFPLANSLAEAPTLISHLVRIAMLGIAWGTTQECLNRAVLEDAELVRLQQVYRDALVEEGEFIPIRRGLVGEFIFLLDTLGDGMALVPDETEGWHFEAFSAASPIVALALPPAAARVTATIFYSDLLLDPRGPLARSLVSPRSHFDDGRARPSPESRFQKHSGEWDDTLYAMAPLLRLVMPMVLRASESEWLSQTRLALPYTAIAVERHRLAHGHLPATLDELVPDYLRSVPADPYNNWEPLSYRVWPDGQYAVYSFGRDGEDGGGVEARRGHFAGDITFTIAPLAVRTGSHISEDAPLFEDDFFTE